MNRDPRPHLLAALGLMLLVAACGEPIDRNKAADAGSADDYDEAAGSGTLEVEAELMEADRMFAADVAAADPADRASVWAGWFVPDGRQIVPGAVVQGTGSIAAMMNGAFTSPGYTLEWDPDSATASPDGMLGWTTGRYINRRETPEGPVEAEGRYLSLWRRLPDGSWKVDLDTGVPDG
jgi:ketosteroid isomerase-like protein